MEIINGIFSEAFWYIATILMAVTVAVSGLFNKLFKASGIWKQVISWVVGAALSVAAYFLGLIQMGDPQWLGVVMLCIVVGLSSNGIYDIPTIKAFINKIFGY